MKCFKVILFTVYLTLTLSGCMYNSTTGNLYELPKLPDEYTALRSELDEILSEGAENAAPVSGTNIQSVQLTDLDGDGTEEAVAFFKKSTDEKPLKIYIFHAVGDSYQVKTVIEGSGTSIYSIRYVDMDGDGIKEILVGWRISAEIQALGVYNIKNREPMPLMFSLYTRYEVLDFDGDNLFELVLLRSNVDGIPVADFYDLDAGSLMLKSTAKLSMTMAELRTMDVGVLRSGETALFVTGVAEDTRSITDILTYRNNTIANVVQKADTGVTGEIFHYIGLEPTDINGDGITEVPAPVPLMTLQSLQDTQWQVDWRSYDASGVGETVLSTYHNTAESWYLVLPDRWVGEISVRQSSIGNEKATVFSARNREGKLQDILAIYTISGSNKEILAAKEGRIILMQQMHTIYAAELFEGNETYSHPITEDQLMASFFIISKEWASGEN